MNDTTIQVEEFLIDVETILKNIFEVDSLWMPLSLEISLGYGVGTENLDLASIDFVELIVQIEESYDITYEFDVEIITIQDLYNLSVYRINTHFTLPVYYASICLITGCIVGQEPIMN